MMRPLIAAVLALGAVFAVQGWKAHIYARGDAAGAARVQQQWDADTARRDADTLAAHLAAQQVLRTQEAVLQQKAERIAHETAQREAQLRAAGAAADARVRSLHTTIAQLNANAAALADVPGTSAGACAAPGSDAAATARELLGACSQRYAAVAAAADQLGGQVTGLQDYVRATAQAQATGDGNGF
jgi:hypothetical protein